MQTATRYGLAGIGGLALLTGVNWVRDQHLTLDPVSADLIGVAPNFAAAIAMIFVPLGIWAAQAPEGKVLPAAARFWTCAAISSIGLIGWELVQRTSQRFVFDLHDVMATLAGVIVASVLFFAMTPRGGEIPATHKADAE